MPYKAEAVERLVAAIFARAGSRDEEARTIARHLVEANLVGHDNLIQQIIHALESAHGQAGCRVRNDCSETVDSDLHLCNS